MKHMGIALTVAIIFSGVAQAQFEPGGGVIDLKINGVLPSASPLGGHQVSYTNVITISVTESFPGGPPRPFVLLFDANGLSPVGYVIGGLGQIDLAFPSVVINGIVPSTAIDTLGLTNFSLSFQYPYPGCNGLVGPGLQAIGLDLASAPFPYTLSQAGQPLQVTGPVVVTNTTIGDDTFVTYASPCGTGIIYAGTSYPSCFIGSNGQITFATGSSDFSPTTPEFFNGFRPAAALGANPGVALFWSDYARGNVATDSIVITNFPNGDLNINYMGQVHWASGLPAGNFDVTFSVSDMVIINGGGHLDGTNTSPTDPAAIVGVTDGTNAPAGLDTNFDISASLGYVSPFGPNSIMEAFNPGPGIAFDVPVLTFAHMGGYAWSMY